MSTAKEISANLERFAKSGARFSEVIELLSAASRLHERHEPRIITVSTPDCTDRGFIRQLFESSAETVAAPDYSPVAWEATQ